MPAEAGLAGYQVFLLGLSLGLTACAVTCLPFIGSWAIGRADGQQTGYIDALSFLSGRLLAYTALGGLAGGLGAVLVRQLAAGYGHLAIGLSSLLAAAWLLWPARRSLCGPIRRMGSLSPFVLGISLTLIPCAPLATLLAASAAAGQSMDGAFKGFLFGLGTMITPMLLIIPATASLGRTLRSSQPWLWLWLRVGAGLTLTVLGYQRLHLFDSSLAWKALMLAGLLLLLAYLRQSRGKTVVHRMAWVRTTEP